MSDTEPQEKILTHVEPESIKRIHVLGVAGTGMGSFAGLLQAAGYGVTGSDENVYPPMSDMLREWGIRTLTPYRAENLDAARPDLVVVGNVIRRVNVEATAMRQRGLPHMSFPAALGDLFLEKQHSVVVAGTHGKTTTSALQSHVLVDAGRDPSFLVGGVTRNYHSNFRLGRGAHFVVEGDEYDTAYFDKGPKFLHYRPKTLILTSVEFDHADIYRDLAHYESSFEKLLALMPENGFVTVCAGYANAVALAKRARCRVESYSAGSASADWSVRAVELGPDGARFVVVRSGKELGRIELAIPGRHNVENALGVYAASSALGLSHEEIARGMRSFTGVKRRQELRGNPGGVAVVDDFAHHPTAVRETIAAVASRYPGRRLLALFEPRSNTSRRNIHQEEYARSFTGAARALILTPKPHDQVPVDAQLSATRLAEDLTRGGIGAQAFATVDELARAALAETRSGDVLLVMSNGAFGGLVETLLKGLEGKS
jgi:UDP-N-acetylmuramate: L-alanyl-gamma-D-glutamyl-meso-diaminopimelate ligase